MTAPTPVKAPSAKRSKKVVDSEGIAHISATFNNLLITITDMRGNALGWGSAGEAGVKSSKKIHPLRGHRGGGKLWTGSHEPRASAGARSGSRAGKRTRVGHSGARLGGASG